MKRIPRLQATPQMITPKIITVPSGKGKASAFFGSIPGWLLTRLNVGVPGQKEKRSPLLVKLLLILVLALVLMGWWAAPLALANPQFLKEANQWIYQSQHTLVDTDAQTWDVTVIKPMEVGRKGVFLHVETESPLVQLDASAPLVLATASGQQLTAANVTQHYFIGSIPDPTVGQYDIQSVLPNLQGEQTLQLQLPTQSKQAKQSNEDNGQGHEAIAINIDQDVLIEWLTVGTCEYLVCDPL